RPIQCRHATTSERARCRPAAVLPRRPMAATTSTRSTTRIRKTQPRKTTSARSTGWIPPRGRADGAIKVLLCRGDEPLLRLWLQYESAGDDAPVPGRAGNRAGLSRGLPFLCRTRRVGSVAPSAGDIVHGVLWRLTPRDIAALHAYELLHQGLYD